MFKDPPEVCIFFVSLFSEKNEFVPLKKEIFIQVYARYPKH